MYLNNTNNFGKYNTPCMLYNCPCDQRVIDIPVKLYFVISNEELERLCTEGYGCQISNVWFNSFAETSGIILTPEEAEEENEKEYEEDDSPIEADLNLDQDYWE